jgi:SSS family solute:Na+ symporter
MSYAATTIIVLLVFMAMLLGITVAAARSNKATPDDFFLADRGLGTVVLLMTSGASFFSTWTLLGAIGSYYRGGVWFIVFAAWTVVHAMFIWMFGARIWHLGVKYDFVTPGDMAEKYYGSRSIRVLFAVFGILGLVPYMLIQITGGSMALTSLTSGAIPYWLGVLFMGLFVGLLVTISGGRGAAWSDTFMGVFFGTVLLFITVLFITRAGGVDAFRNVADVAPEVLTVQGNFWGALDLAVGLVLGFWIMPHMWQKFYSAKSPSTLAKTSILTPFWNSWLMAVGALFIGVVAHVPGVVPGLTAEASDQIIPTFFSTWAPFFGAIVVAAIIAAGVSTINSQLLSSASLFSTDLYGRFFKQDATDAQKARGGRITVLLLTLVVIVLAFLPAAQGFLVPLASLGFGISVQLVPAALGPLVWRRATAMGALASVLLGEAVLAIVYLGGSPFPVGPATSGLIAGMLAFVLVSLVTQRANAEVQDEFHDELEGSLFAGEPVSNQL